MVQPIAIASTAELHQSSYDTRFYLDETAALSQECAELGYLRAGAM
jgi:hypothetical protein